MLWALEQGSLVVPVVQVALVQVVLVRVVLVRPPPAAAMPVVELIQRAALVVRSLSRVAVIAASSASNFARSRAPPTLSSKSP